MEGDIEADVLCEAETDSRTDTDGLVEMLVEAESELLLLLLFKKTNKQIRLVWSTNGFSDTVTLYVKRQLPSERP